MIHLIHLDPHVHVLLVDHDKQFVSTYRCYLHLQQTPNPLAQVPSLSPPLSRQSVLKNTKKNWVKNKWLSFFQMWWFAGTLFREKKTV